MREPDVFVLADRALSRVVGEIRDDQWEIVLPESFRTRRMDHTPTLREIVNYHAYTRHARRQDDRRGRT